MKDKIYKFAYYTRKKGVRHAVSLAKQSIKKKTQSQARPFKDIYVMAGLEDVVNADFISRPYQKPKARQKKKLNIAWVLSPISAGSGGQNTITRFVRHLQAAGHSVTIYIYEAIHPQQASVAQDILLNSFRTDVKVLPIADYSDADALIATGWETAYPVFNLKTSAHKFYFIQDYEPLFYGLGSMAVLAQNTYRFNFYGITAGRWLSHKVTSEFGMQADHFDFGVDLDIYKPAAMPKKKKKICFYARPVTERRAFELGVIALDVFYKKHPEYEIEFFGWDVSEYKIPFPYINRGILSHSDLAELFQESAACLVLSLTNVSLLPLELLASGCVPVMNDGDNNRMVLGENKYIRYTGSSPIELANGICEAVENKNLQKDAEAASTNVNDRSWDASYKKVEQILMREVTGDKEYGR